ncbi:hypothetical protein Q0590_23055 [Rhodocytophaga aerolata]|uniref:AIM24 family protein n=1 Tax=Rhodocytophaga aerolata TaxID=455078 RepID=A0ABT8RAQ1_9BACT|nr:hypothetical protein [Rhodocytophaga aerolata]MDO1449174.1 hypothetical protein [Rhodocytophaga aerolata]
MGKAKELDGVPISDSTPEFHFGLTSPNCRWVEFEKNNYSAWRGSFTNDEYGINKVIALSDNNEFLVIAMGAGYWIDNELNALIFRVPLESISFAAKINEKEVLVANWMGFYLLQSDSQLVKVEHMSDLGSIKVEQEDSIMVKGKLEAYDFDWEEVPFQFDKQTKQLTINNGK